MRIVKANNEIKMLTVSVCPLVFYDQGTLDGTIDGTLDGRKTPKYRQKQSAF